MKKLNVKIAKFFLILLVPSMFLFSCEDDVDFDAGTPEKDKIVTPPR